MIQIRELTKKFGDRTAVDRVSFDVTAGEVLGLLGPNGAGKTTTIRMLACLIEPTSGEVVIDGHRASVEADQIRKLIGIVTEVPGLYENITVWQNLHFFGRLHNLPDIPSQIEKYLRLLSLWDRKDAIAATLSKGMKQKVALARALIHEPRILFLDEPTSGLDPQMTKVVREFIQDLRRQGRTIILCTHNLDEAERLSDRIVVLKTTVVAVDTPEALRRKLFGRSVVLRLR
ncbi:MAG: ABC transporter ATP-binding protein, partial [Acidobacteria bacterium]|nr:ABC transporter ATP-binding protein [Acidobacteriota bacterium]